MVALSLTRAHAKTASSGYSKLRMLPVEAPPLQMAALGWLGGFCQWGPGMSVWVVCLHSVPVDYLVHGDLGCDAVLPPADVVLGDDPPGSMVHAEDVVLHSVGVGHVVGCRFVGARDVAEVVRFAKVVPGEYLDDVWCESRVGNGM